MSPFLIVVLALVGGLVAMRWWLARRSPEQVREMREVVASGGLLLDVRTPDEYRAGALRGALNIPLQSLRARLHEVVPEDRDAPKRKGKRHAQRKTSSRSADGRNAVVVYCASGIRSRTAAQILRQAGCNQVLDLGPMSNWDKAA